MEKNVSEIRSRNLEILERIITESIRIKVSIAKNDPFDRNMRAVLNLGHTIGHAIETALDYRHIKHGEAISIGMVGACRLSRKLGILEDNLDEYLETLFQAFNLPVRLKISSCKKIILSMQMDKKREGGKSRFILPVKLGKVIIRNDLSLKDVKEVLEEIQN